MACRDVRSGVLPPVPSQSSDDSLGPIGKVEAPFSVCRVRFLRPVHTTIIALVLVYLFVLARIMHTPLI